MSNKIKLNEEEVNEVFRTLVLKALDDAMVEATGSDHDGWKDQDLAELFKVLDAHVHTNLRRLRSDQFEITFSRPPPELQDDWGNDF